jgi:hypothetical protein
VRVVEAVFSLPRNSTIDHRSYFADCTQWIGERFGESNILSSDVHLDEAAPHCHVLFLPLVDGRMRGSDLLGGRARIAELANDFHAKVATLYGLPRRVPKLDYERKQRLAKIVIERLLSTSSAATTCEVWQSTRGAIENDPEPFAAELGIELPEHDTPPKRKTFTDTMIGKGKRTSEDANPIGFVKRSKTSNHILCRVRLSADDVSQPKPAPDACQPIRTIERADSDQSEKNSVSDTGFSETTRVRDSDYSPESFNPETGEFVEKKVRPQHRKLAAAKWLDDQLPSKRRSVSRPRNDARTLRR